MGGYDRYIRFVEDPAVYIGYEESIHSAPDDGQCAR